MAFYIYMDVYIPDRMGNGIVDYIEHGRPPGSFLHGVFCNDLVKAVYKADEENGNNLRAYVAYLRDKAPGDCWGSEEIVKRWILIGGLRGKGRVYQ